MRDTTKFASGSMFAAVVAVLMSGLLASPLQLNAQNCSGSQGQNAVYNPTCTNPVVGSSAFIDASMFATSADTICSTIYKILALSGYSPAVARFLLDRLLAAR